MIDYLDNLKDVVEIQEFGFKKDPKRIFHITSQEVTGLGYLQPKVPQNEYTSIGLEESDIPRISCAPSVDYCLLALGEDYIKFYKNVLWVCEPKFYEDLKPITNEELVRKGWVPDAKQTKEMWLLTPTQFKTIAKIRVLRKSSKYVVLPDFRRGKVTDEKRPREDRKIYFFEWKIIKGKI